MTINKRKIQRFNKGGFTISLDFYSIPMLSDIFVLTWFMCFSHERFTSISKPKNLVTFSLSMTILFFKKDSGSLKNIKNYSLLRLGEIENILRLLNLAIIYLLRDISLCSQFISERRSSTFILERKKLVSSANMAGNMTGKKVKFV